jgi:ubiquinone biosynthesis protein COQ9
MLVGLRHPNLFPTLGRLTQISDELWFLAGDKFTNLNWYIRRYLLTKVYILTELHMI